MESDGSLPRLQEPPPVPFLSQSIAVHASPIPLPEYIE